MKTSDFSFELPEELIAQQPPAERGTARLMVVDRASGAVRHRHIPEIVDEIEPGTVMVFNDSRVRKARVYLTPATGERSREVEVLLVRRQTAATWLAIGRGLGRIAVGSVYQCEGVRAAFGEVDGPYRELTFDPPIDNSWLDSHGHVPLPPYIHRGDSDADAERYQTVYARVAGSVAAPTAGLHFTDELIARLRERGVDVRFVTLHVGIGTFLPVRTESLEEHDMHTEEYHVSPATADAVSAARRAGRPVLAVGTTVVRTLESAWDSDEARLHAGHGATNLFIYPGYRFRAIDHLFTNFHTPESTLVALVSAFAGRDLILERYREAVELRYRFFSYGDAMLLR